MTHIILVLRILLLRMSLNHSVQKQQFAELTYFLRRLELALSKWPVKKIKMSQSRVAQANNQVNRCHNVQQKVNFRIFSTPFFRTSAKQESCEYQFFWFLVWADKGLNCNVQRQLKGCKADALTSGLFRRNRFLILFDKAAGKYWSMLSWLVCFFTIIFR